MDLMYSFRQLSAGPVTLAPHQWQKIIYHAMSIAMLVCHCHPCLQCIYLTKTRLSTVHGLVARQVLGGYPRSMNGSLLQGEADTTSHIHGVSMLK